MLLKMVYRYSILVFSIYKIFTLSLFVFVRNLSVSEKKTFCADRCGQVNTTVLITEDCKISINKVIFKFNL